MRYKVSHVRHVSGFSMMEMMVVMAILLPAGCGEDAGERVHQVGSTTGERVAVLSGQSAGVAAFLVPTHFQGEPMRFAATRLNERIGQHDAGGPFTFASLFLFNVAAPEEGDEQAVRISEPTVQLETATGTVANSTLGAALTRDDVVASVLPALALETFDGVLLAPGSSVKALVAFPRLGDPGDPGDPGDLAGVHSALVRMGPVEVSLEPESISEAEYDELHARPSRDQVVASAGEEVNSKAEEAKARE